MKKRNKILVIDVESTCWDNPKVAQRNVSEIIEIGLTEVTCTPEGWEIGETLSYPILPVFSDVSAFCTQLTGWTHAELKAKGKSYVAVMNEIKKLHNPKECIIACWGKYDDKMFQTMSKLHQTGYPFNNDYLNVKALYGAVHCNVMSVEAALKMVGEDFEGTPHRGSDDSRNIAKLLVRLLNSIPK